MADSSSVTKDLHYKAVTRENLADLFALMHGHQTFSSCACMRCRLRPGEFERLGPAQRREALQERVKRGGAVGVLAYGPEGPIAWCSVAPRESFEALPASSTAAPGEMAAVWSVTCFWVAPAMRGQGVASALLRAAVEYARTRGAKVVEGYPVSAKHAEHQRGSLGIFRRAGFRDVTPPGRRSRLMRTVIG